MKGAARRASCLLAAAAIVILAVGCGADEPLTAGRVTLRASLHDVPASPAPAGRAAWSTLWRLCWQASGAADGFELQPLTSEGPGRVRRAAGSCTTLEVAAGEGGGRTRVARRATQLAQVRSELAYRVRAIGAGDRRGPWSCAAEAGAVGGCAPSGALAPGAHDG